MDKLVLALCFAVALFQVGSCATSLAFFYAHKAPSYTHYPKTANLRRDTPDFTKITNIHVHVGGPNEVRASEFNTTLQHLFNGWRECSDIQFVEPVVTFNQTVMPCHTISHNPSNADVNYIYIDPPGQCRRQDGAIGEGTVNGRESILYASSYWNDPRLVAHELGHNMGLYHASRNGEEYGDPTCVMGLVDNYMPSRKLCFNAPHMDTLQWTNTSVLIKAQEVEMNISSPIYKVDTVYYVHYLDQKVFVYKKIPHPQNADTELVAILQEGIQDINTDTLQLHYVPHASTLTVVEKGTFPKNAVINFVFLLPLLIIILGFGVFFYRT